MSPRNLNAIATKQEALFPETVKDRLWQTPTAKKRYNLAFPFYPFRTLCPRDLHLISSTSSSAGKNLFEFDPTAPLFPANTQLDIVFTKRNTTNFLNYMLPIKLDINLGNREESLTETQRQAATSFVVQTIREGGGGFDEKTYIITSVDINISDMYLQVMVILYSMG